ncbi:uncharacterized protein LOC114283253 [Camellia sinensis]|uniref:uncharacterized protein LOC114283253 n=1 Tax=Camellia sinensis TaxID=4442 RepID=UPI001036A632|nr:uncharacterized protein LOC114283253 [Camellia sinensis]
MVDTDYKKAQKFEGGLDLDVFNRVGVLKLPTYVEVLNRALIEEATLAAKKQSKAPITKWRGKRSGFSFKKGRSFTTSKKQNTGSTSSSSQSIQSAPICAQCRRRHRGVCHRISGACFQCGKMCHIIRVCSIGLENVNCPVASSAGFVFASRPNIRTNARGNTGNETLRQWRVFILVPGDVQNTESVVSDIIQCSMIRAYVFPTCDIMIGDVTLYVDLLPLEIDHFNSILDIDWNGVIPPPYLISFVKAKKLLRKGCQGYLCYVFTLTSDGSTVENISVVNKFPDVFPNELPKDLIDREIKFTIDVVPKTQPISKTLYRMSTYELKELKLNFRNC